MKKYFSSRVFYDRSSTESTRVFHNLFSFLVSLFSPWSFGSSLFSFKHGGFAFTFIHTVNFFTFSVLMINNSNLHAIHSFIKRKLHWVSAELNSTRGWRLNSLLQKIRKLSHVLLSQIWSFSISWEWMKSS